MCLLWRQIRVYLQTTGDVFQSLWMLLLPSVRSDAHLTSLHECCVSFLHSSSPVEEKNSAVRHPGITPTHAVEGDNTHTMDTFYLPIVIVHWLYTWFNRDQI